MLRMCIQRYLKRISLKKKSEKKTFILRNSCIELDLGLILYQFGSLTFWSVLALVAVFHFIRQQYGFMRIYARFEPNNWSKKLMKLRCILPRFFRCCIGLKHQELLLVCTK
jgi:hypothetical protein